MGKEVRDRSGRLPAIAFGEASTAELASWSERVERQVADLESEAGSARSEARAAELTSQLQAMAASGELATAYVRRGPAASESGASTGRKSRPEPEGDELDELLRSVEHVVARVHPEATDADRARVDSTAQALVVGGRVDRRTLLVELKAVVDDIARACEVRAEQRRKAEMLVQSLDGVVGPDVDDARQLLDRVIAGSTSLSDADVERVARIRARAIALEDQRYVAEHLAAAFVELGYELDPGAFASDLVREGSAYAFVDEGDDHAVELELKDGRYAFRIVHTADGADASRDEALELELCKGVGAISAGARDLGVVMTLEGHAAAGATPIRRSARRVTRTTSRTAEPRQRERKR
jgi:hypothetical protein